MGQHDMNRLITDSGVSSILDDFDKLLPIIDRLDDENIMSYALGLPALIGVFCFLPGLLLGLLLPRPVSWLLIGFIVILAVIFPLMMSVADKTYQKKYLKSAEAVGVSREQAEEFQSFWNGLNSKARKRIKKEKNYNAKNK